MGRAIWPGQGRFWDEDWDERGEEYDEGDEGDEGDEWDGAWTRSILFWRMMMCLSRMISTAARCSEVCGCGQVSLPAMSRRAPSMTAAPLSIVACARKSGARRLSACGPRAFVRRTGRRVARGRGRKICSSENINNKGSMKDEILRRYAMQIV